MTQTDSQPEGSRYQLLHRMGVALSAEREREHLFDLILVESQSLCRADGGTLYLLNDNDELEFAIVKNTSLGVELGGKSEKPIEFSPLALFEAQSGEPNQKNVATYAVHERRPVHISDVYHSKKFDFSATKEFDRKSGYRTRSIFTIPLINSKDQVIGVLQLINAQDETLSHAVPFERSHQETMLALASQAAIALDNKMLLASQTLLLDSFIKMMASAIDAKSPYTGTHCERVPIITEMLISEVCQTKEGPFSDFDLNKDERYELHIASWLHDCGKVTTPTHIMDKATKLETVHDRMDEIASRFEILKRDAQISYWQGISSGEEKTIARERLVAVEVELEAELLFLRQVNVGGETLSKEAQLRILRIGEKIYEQGGKQLPLLSSNEIENLTISKGTLTPDERMIVNGHMVQTVRMLDALPFPRNLRRVPEYATGHHEKMDGTGYPRGIFAGDMSVPARVLAIADIFEALTAEDRPYKPAKKLSETMGIMGRLKRDNHLDPQLFDIFVKNHVFLRYAEKFMDPSLIDEVDCESLLAIQPRKRDFPDQQSRKSRQERLLPTYEERFPLRKGNKNPLSVAPLSPIPPSRSKGTTTPLSLRSLVLNLTDEDAADEQSL